MALVRLKELYPIGIDETKATQEAIERFQRWKDSSSFACLTEDGAKKSFPKVFLKKGEQHIGECSGRPDIITECEEAFERYYPLKDGRLVVKKVVHLIYPNGWNPEFGNQEQSSMYFFR